MKALYLYNFTKYIQWPESMREGDFKIGFASDNEGIYNELLRVSETKKAVNQNIIIERIYNVNQIKDLHIFFFDYSSGLTSNQVLKAIDGNPVLMVSDGYPVGQSMINFVVVNNRQKFELVKEVVNRHYMNISTGLLSLAIMEEADKEMYLKSEEYKSLLEKFENMANLSVNGEININVNDLNQLVSDQKELQEENLKITNDLKEQQTELKRIKSEQKMLESLLSSTEKELIEKQLDVKNKELELRKKENNLKGLNIDINSKSEEISMQQEQLKKDKEKLNEIQKRFSNIDKLLREKEELVEKQENQLNVSKEEIATQKNIIILASVFILITLVLGGLAYNSYRQKNKANKIILAQNKEAEKQRIAIEKAHSELAEHHKEIADSINYAKRIQEAIMPSFSDMNNALKNGFVYYQPKDVVAGDFFWMEKIEDVVYYAAADCTGHGVPGAMVSVVCSNALTKALVEEKNYDVAKLLDRTREIVISRLARSGEKVKDGMDISLCALNMKTKELSWAGANNPLWIFRKGIVDVLDIEEIKPDKQPIGYFELSQPFSAHTVKLNEGDSIYVFTDGYQDQFGGPKGKKFKAKQLKEILLANISKPMDDQKSILLDKFNNWKDGFEQVDDVCVIGVRI